MQYLSNKVAVITGAAGAIGRESVAVFQREGATVVGVDLRGEVDADHFVTADLTVEDQVAALYDEVATRYGRVDVLFNNAGVALPADGSVLETSIQTFEQIMRINATSVFLCCKHGIPHLVRGGGGAVVNTASLVASMGSATSQIAYTASKGAVLALTREMAVEFAKKGVRINSLSPGPVETPLLAALFSQDEKARRLVHVPYGRFARAAEIAEAAAWLASDSASYVTATDFRVDGGITAAYVTPEDEPGEGAAS